jgi:hypothetical protein
MIKPIHQLTSDGPHSKSNHLPLRHSRELTRVCSPKLTHQSVAGVVGLDALRGLWTTTRQDLARAKQFEKAFWNVASYFSAPRKALHASGVDDTLLVLAVATSCSQRGSL